MLFGELAYVLLMSLAVYVLVYAHHVHRSILFICSVKPVVLMQLSLPTNFTEVCNNFQQFLFTDLIV